MRHVRAYGIAALASFVVAAAAYAQTAEPATDAATVTPLPEAAPVVAAPLDTAATEALAQAQWGDAKAGVCAACHGVDGNPSDPMYPRIAGMPERYVAEQLALYKSGQRNTGMAALMVPMASMLSAQEMRDVGAYFAQQKPGAGIADDTVIAEGQNEGMKFYQVGERLFRGGDLERGIPACMACHGPTGGGNPGPAYPNIGGQQSAYVVQRLQEYRAGDTSIVDSGNFEIMATVAKSLTDEEIQSLGSFLQGLHHRADDAPAIAGTP